MLSKAFSDDDDDDDVVFVSVIGLRGLIRCSRFSSLGFWFWSLFILFIFIRYKYFFYLKINRTLS